MSHDNSSHEWLERSDKDIKADLMGTLRTSKRVRRIILLLAAVTLVGVASMVIKLVVADGDQASWGYVAALFSFVISLSTGAPVLYLGSVLAKGYWGGALSRISCMFILSGIFSALLLLLLILQLPSLTVDGILRRSIWFEAPNYSPHIWAVVALCTVILCGMLLLYVNSLPDLAMMRTSASGWRQRLAKRLSRNWTGTDVEWRVLRATLASLVLLYLFAAAMLHVLVSSDFSMSLVPGWRDAIYPVYHAVTAVQVGIACLIIGCYIASKYGGMGRYITNDHFWNMGRFLFVASLGWVYLFFSGFIVLWYGRSQADIGVIDLIVTGPMIGAMIITAVFAFVLPLFILMWNAARRSPRVVFIASIIVIVGIFFDRLRLFVPAWSVPIEGIHGRYLTAIPSFVAPDVWDVIITIGVLASAVLMPLLASRFIPLVPVWQLHEYRKLIKPVKYVKAHGLLVAKSD